MFNFYINNLLGKPIIDKGLFYIFKFVKEGSAARRDTKSRKARVSCWTPRWGSVL